MRLIGRLLAVFCVVSGWSAQALAHGSDAPIAAARKPAAVETGTLEGAAFRIDVPAKWNTIDWSTGTGSLELARGTDHLTADGVVLTGEQDIFGHSFNAPAMATLEAAGSS